MTEPFAWDPHSDQPYQLKDRAFKKSKRRASWASLLKTALTALSVLPLSLLGIPFLRPKPVDTDRFFGLGVNPEKEPDLTPELVDELGVTSLIIRFRLWEMDELEHCLAFVRRFKGRRVLLNVMQDREHVEDTQLLAKHLYTVFERFGPHVDAFQIGTTINRAKWGFFSVDEYLRFYQVAFDLKQSIFPDITLVGSGVIDFEYHFTAHTLFHGYPAKYDAVAALLYVDRRGAPENGQMGFNLSKKIAWLAAMVRLSPKSADRILLTETNWPITGTAPYAPTSEYECVDEESYADFMVRYYLLAFASGQVEGVYWHQLVAPGYGLIDNREGIRKRSAFLAFKTMVSQLKGAQCEGLDIQDGRYTLRCRTPHGELHVVWSLKEETVRFEETSLCVYRDGEEAELQTCKIGSSPVYIHKNKRESNA